MIRCSQDCGGSRIAELQGCWVLLYFCGRLMSLFMIFLVVQLLRFAVSHFRETGKIWNNISVRLFVKVHAACMCMWNWARLWLLWNKKMNLQSSLRLMPTRTLIVGFKFLRFAFWCFFEQYQYLLYPKSPNEDEIILQKFCQILPPLSTLRSSGTAPHCGTTAICRARHDPTWTDLEHLGFGDGDTKMFFCHQRELDHHFL